MPGTERFGPNWSKRQLHRSSSLMKSDKWYLVWAALCFMGVVSLLYVYSFSPLTLTIAGFEVKKIGNPDEVLDDIVETNEVDTTKALSQEVSSSSDSAKTKENVQVDTNAVELDSYSAAPIVADSAVNDSTHHRILLLGDSEAGGIKNVLNDYCRSNGHKLIASIEWYSATSLNFAKGDTISKIIAKYKPTYIFVLFGLNEVLARDGAHRKALARQFQKRLRKVPYAWIGPTNWGKDFVVTDAFRAAADSAAFFSSKSLVLPKATDGRHPSLAGYRIWMANIANWLQTSARWKMKMATPDRVGYPKKYRTIVLNAAEYSGY
jgi:hypothetical protein